MSERYKQILGDWYWDEKWNLLVHECSECSETDISDTGQIDSEIRCMRCKKEVPQAVVDICLLCNIKPWSIYKTIKGKWLVKRASFDPKLYLAHQCIKYVYSTYCSSTNCPRCKTRVPKYIIKYCKENNVGI